MGLFPTNDWGWHDLHGNVREWCLNAWHDSYTGAPDDGRVWVSEGSQEVLRLLRGDSWFDVPGNCRSACRYYYQPGDADNLVGFRVVCLPQGPSLHP